MKWKPKLYMMRAAKFLLERSGAALFLDPGMSKTAITLAALLTLKLKGEGPTLIVAPLRVCQLVWPAELAKWSDSFGSLRLETLHGPRKAEALKRKADIYLINPEGLAWLFSVITSKKWPWVNLVIDESTKFKNWSSKRTKLMRKNVRFFRRRWILTGGPRPKSYEDLFAQIFIIDGGAALGKYVTHFRASYFDRDPYAPFPLYTLRDGAEDKIEKKIRHLAMRLDAEDWLEMPARADNPIWVVLPPEARKIYDKLEREFFLLLEEGVVTAANAGVLTMKLRQAANGQLYTDSKSTAKLHEAKLEALADLFEEMSGAPLLTAVAFQSEVVAIRRALKRPKAPYLGQGLSRAAAVEAEQAWNASKIDLLIAHPASASLGLNLQAQRHLCWFGLTWNYEEYDQLFRRLWRQGQQGCVMNHLILAKDTVDLVMLESLQSKGLEQKSLLDALRKYSLKRQKA